ncbi:amidohydrolase [Legionella oakridgensis]|uniref:N-substituted formamide deformylase n=2 Tax=Legionella oakridgensis TaxID=29423 RepID=A0A0W0XH30_9GAMM|nr:amidohydrolase family protein [Legionella oakridgensis]AHE66080.1 putative metal-dependent hydrolase with the TIM-barrel fold [Legionella oakridgensis ATCC 33761 = DSM 21215]ETO94146.1 putative metal-dependent hydrolase [Legionella oakridgensis RV-2-2007]KTD43832.1 N-substituted formamide deformylase precursor [Legionella oakridgensis]STY15999.1 N-substituted formamide deformylase precursor [Legionella longbeachae]
MQFFLIIFTFLFIKLIYPSALYASEIRSSAMLCRNADKIFTNATFLTMNPNQPVAKAVAVTKERIVAIGEKKQLLNRCQGENTKIINLKNTIVTPGFIDTYSQFVLYGWLANHAFDVSTSNVFQRDDWKPVKTLDQFLTTIKHQPKNRDQWLIISGFDESKIHGGQLTTAMLDDIADNSPVIVFSSSAEKALLNHAAMDKIKQQDDGKTLAIEADGSVSGTSLNTLLNKLIPPNEVAEAIKTAANRYARQGYTTVTQVYGPNDWLPIYDELTQNANLPVDVIYNPSTLADKQRLDIIYKDNPRLYPGPLLLQVDGPVQDFSAYLTRPYTQSSPPRSIDWRGTLKQSTEGIEKTISEANKNGLAIAIDSHGDAALDLSLNAIQKIQSVSKNHKPTPVILNMQYVREDQLTRMRQMGIKASWFGPYLYYWGESMCYEGLGSERAHRSNPVATAEKILGNTSVHAGTPSASPAPLQIMNWLITRKVQKWNYPVNRKCPPYFAIEERVNAQDALQMFTIHAAELYGIDEDKGSLALGKLADMAILSGNPLNSNLETITVLGTITRGIVHWNEPQDH